MRQKGVKEGKEEYRFQYIWNLLEPGVSSLYKGVIFP